MKILILAVRLYYFRDPDVEGSNAILLDELKLRACANPDFQYKKIIYTNNKRDNI